jgi:hypothetical protein
MIMILTMALSIVGFALAVVQAGNGAGRHRGDVPADTYQYGMLINFVSQPVYRNGEGIQAYHHGRYGLHALLHNCMLLRKSARH